MRVFLTCALLLSPASAKRFEQRGEETFGSSSYPSNVIRGSQFWYASGRLFNACNYPGMNPCKGYSTAGRQKNYCCCEEGLVYDTMRDKDACLPKLPCSELKAWKGETKTLKLCQKACTDQGYESFSYWHQTSDCQCVKQDVRGNSVTSGSVTCEMAHIKSGILRMRANPNTKAQIKYSRSFGEQNWKEHNGEGPMVNGSQQTFWETTQTPVALDIDTYVFGAHDGSRFYMESFDQAGEPKEARNTFFIEDLSQLTYKIWKESHFTSASTSPLSCTPIVPKTD